MDLFPAGARLERGLRKFRHAKPSLLRSDIQARASERGRVAEESFTLQPPAQYAYIMNAYRQVSVIVLGSFNPAIFHPEWFRTNEILPSVEVDAATDPAATTATVIAGSKGMVTTNDVTAIMFQSLRLEVQRDRWTLSTERADWIEDLGTIASSVFQRLHHTPVTTLGINFVEHRPWPTIDEFMLRWVPVENLARLAGANPQVGASVKGTWDDYSVQLIIEHSVKVKPGLFMLQNYERPLKGGTRELGEVIRLDWPKILERRRSVVAQLEE